MLWRVSQVPRHFSTGQVSPAKASIHVLVLFSRPRGVAGPGRPSWVGSDAQTLLEGTVEIFFGLGDFREGCGCIRDGSCQVSLCLMRGTSCTMNVVPGLAGMTSWGTDSG